MKTDNYEKLNEIINELVIFRNDIYDYDYDEYALWYLDEAITQLKRV